MKLILSIAISILMSSCAFNITYTNSKETTSDVFDDVNRSSTNEIKFYVIK